MLRSHRYPSWVSFWPRLLKQAEVLCLPVATLWGLLLAGNKAFQESEGAWVTGGTALPVTSLKPWTCAVPVAGVPIASSPTSDKGTWTSAHKAANPGASILAPSKALGHLVPQRKPGPACFLWPASWDGPGSSTTRSPRLCLDFPKTNICLASPVWSRSVLSREGWGRAAAAPGVGGQWGGL